jgi:hypothetical protein
MIDNEIPTALVCCINNDCNNCPLDNKPHFVDCLKSFLDFINSQNVESKRLKEHNNKLMSRIDDLVYECDCAKQEAYKEFMKLVKDKATVTHKTRSGKRWYEMDDGLIDAIYEELMEGNKDD